MTDTTYNGWKNYETWAVNMYLEYVTDLVRSQLSFQHLEADGMERSRVADYLKDFIEEETTGGIDTENALNPLVSDLLGASLSSVDWYEIADAWIENVREQA